jgi:hypothetical protein
MAITVARVDRPPELPVDFAAEVLAADQTDVKLQSRSIARSELACRTLQELALVAVLCPSYLATDAAGNAAQRNDARRIALV